MANPYYQRQAAFQPRTKAKSDDVKNELDAVQAGFEQLPSPTAEADGFSVPIKVGTASDPAHAVTLAQLQGTEAAVEADKNAAASSAAAAASSESNAAASASSAQQSAAEAAASAQAAAASNGIDDDVTGVNSTWSSDKIQLELNKNATSSVDGGSASSVFINVIDGGTAS